MQVFNYYKPSYKEKSTSNLKFGTKPQMLGRIVGKTDVDGFFRNIPIQVTHQKATELYTQYDKFNFYKKNNELAGWIMLQNMSERKKSLIHFDSDRVNIAFLESGIHGLGRKLVQAAIEFSMKIGHGGKVTLLADNVQESSYKAFKNKYQNPTGFYYEKCHFQAAPSEGPNANAMIERELKRIRDFGLSPDKAKLNNTHMILPIENFLSKWLPEIQKKPILTDL